MNMSPKIVKTNNQTNLITPLEVPELGEGNAPKNGFYEFSAPRISEVKPNEKISEKSFISDNSPEEILQKARDEAAQIIKQAELDSELIAEATKEKALQEVDQKISAGVEENSVKIRETFAQTINQISSLQNDITNRIDKDLVELALEIAKKIVGDEVENNREIALKLVKTSLAKLDPRTDAKVHLHPEDFAFVSARQEELEIRGTLELVEDKSISIGGCLVETQTGDIDARIESQFEEITHGLLDH